MTTTRNARRQLRGEVITVSGDKTITVQVTRTYKHPKYGKFMRRRKKYLAHDPENTANLGDTVAIAAIRPISKRKRWLLVDIVEKGDAIAVAAPEVNAVSAVEIVATKPAEGGDA